MSEQATAVLPPRRVSTHPYGWPLKPFDRQHPVRANVDDPRIGKHGSHAFHFGIDISAPDGTAVYAVKEGEVYRSPRHVAVVSPDRSHAFWYWHIVPVVAHKQFVRKHQLLGHIQIGEGHVHLAESWGPTFVNPLRAGAITPYVDHVAPTVKSIFVSSGHDGFEIVANAFDTPAMRVPEPWTSLPVTPALVQWRAVRDGFAEPAWRNAVDFRYRVLDKKLYWRIYAAGTVQNRAGEAGRYCFRIASHWHPVDGSYRLQVRAYDTWGNRAQLELALRVAGGKIVEGSRTLEASAHPYRWPIISISGSNGDSLFAGDGTLLTTISPNGDGFRDRALIHVRLAAAATVKFQVVNTRIHPDPVFTRAVRLGIGAHTLIWAPPAETTPGSYLILLDVRAARGTPVLYGARSARAQWHGNTPVVRVQGLDAGFTRESYRAGETATLAVATDATHFSLQVFSLGPNLVRTLHDSEMHGVALTDPQSIDWQSHRSTRGSLQVPVGNWPSGVYYVQLSDDSGRVGYAPLIVRPDKIGVHRVAVVLPTNTWQAYNVEDLNGNGWGDTWYAGWVVTQVRLGRHSQGWGMPPVFRRYDLPYLRWLQNASTASTT